MQFSFPRVSTCLTCSIFLDLIAQTVLGEECTQRSSSLSIWYVYTMHRSSQDSSFCNTITGQYPSHTAFDGPYYWSLSSFIHSLTLLIRQSLRRISGPNQFYQHLHCECSTTNWGDRWWMSPKTPLTCDSNRHRAADGLYSTAGAAVGTKVTGLSEVHIE
jgi:hypothetical protein